MTAFQIKVAAKVLDLFLDEVKLDRIVVEQEDGSKTELYVPITAKTKLSAARCVLEAYIK